MRTKNDLTLFSDDRSVLAQRSLPNDYWFYFLASRRALAVSASGRLDLLDMRTLATTLGCAYYGEAPIASVSDGSILRHAPSRSGDPYVERAMVSRTCGPPEYAFDEIRGTFGSTLLDDRTVVSTGTGTVVVYDSGVERWRDPRYRKNDLADGSVRCDEGGKVFAVMVKSFAGGSRILELDSHISKARIVVYRASNGEHLADVPVTRLPLSVFDFAVSRDGKLLGVYSDGDLRVFPVSAP